MTNKFVPKFKTRKQAKQEALEAIKQGKSQVKTTLITRYPYLNIAMGKGFSFKKIVLIAGLSGHGKSKLLNDLLMDFNDETINKNLGVSMTNAQPFTIVTVHFCLEMLPLDEILRETSSEYDVSYSYLLGLQYNGVKKDYDIVDDRLINILENKFKNDDNPNYYYFEDSCNVIQMDICMQAVVVDYKNRYGLDDNYVDEQGVQHRPKFVIAVDHTMLVDAVGKEDILATMSRISKFSIRWKKLGALVILVGQFNNNIESPERIKNSTLHYPTKSDIYAQAQVYNACDTVLTTLIPGLLGILKYTVKSIDTTKLLNVSVIKNRGLNIGQLWFRTELEKGIIHNIPQESL